MKLFFLRALGVAVPEPVCGMGWIVSGYQERNTERLVSVSIAGGVLPYGIGSEDGRTGCEILPVYG